MVLVVVARVGCSIFVDGIVVVEAAAGVGIGAGAGVAVEEGGKICT